MEVFTQDSYYVLLQNETAYQFIYESIEAENTLETVEVFKFPFTKVYNAIEKISTDFISVLIDFTGLTELEILQSNANKMVKYQKWLQSQINNCVLLLNNIESHIDTDYQSAGTDKLEIFGEFNIYYKISENPTEWEAISMLPFQIVLVKLQMDGIRSIIEHDYMEIIKRKK